MSNVGIVCLDGDVPSQNAAIEAARTQSLRNGAQKVYGINDGMEGLLRANNVSYDVVAKDITTRSIDLFHFQCILPTSTTRSSQIDDSQGHPYTPASAAKRIEETLSHIGNGIDKLILISGSGGIFDFREIAHNLNGIEWVFIMKSMNNDIGRKNPNPELPYSPLISIGYEVAATVGKYTATLASPGAHNQHRVVLFENLGRISGFPGAATMASAADFVILPEIFNYYDKLTVDQVLEEIVDIIYQRHSGMRATIGSLTEAVPTSQSEVDDLRKAYANLSTNPNVKLKGKVHHYAENIKKMLDQRNYHVGKVTCADITYSCRWTYPTEIGIFLAQLYGKAAANKLFSPSTQDKQVTPFLTFDNLVSVNPDDWLEEVINMDGNPRLITHKDLGYLKADEAIIQTVPREYIDQKDKYKITETFLQVLHRLTITRMAKYIPQPRI